MSCSPVERSNTCGSSEGNDLNNLQASNVSVSQGIASVPDTIASAESTSSLIGSSELTYPGVGITTSSSMVFLQEIPKELYQDLTVNPAVIAKVPHWFDSAKIQDMANSTVPPIHIDELLIQFDRICDLMDVKNHQVLYQEKGIGITREDAKRSLKNNYLEMVYNHLDSENAYDRTISREIDATLKGVIFNLRLPADPNAEDAAMIGKKRTAIEDLCRASRHGVARRHMEAFKVYCFFSSQEEILSEIIQQHIQSTKEVLFFNYYSLATQPLHMLNYIRRAVGEEIGLPMSDYDPYIEFGADSARSPENRYSPHTQPDQFRAVFKRLYTPEYILFNMKNSLNEKIVSDVDFMCVISQFIMSKVRAYESDGRLDAADVSDLPMPYLNAHDHPSARLQLTDAGIKFLMVHFQHLNSATPNGHLVRAAAVTT